MSKASATAIPPGDAKRVERLELFRNAVLDHLQGLQRDPEVSKDVQEEWARVFVRRWVSTWFLDFRGELLTARNDP